MFQKYDANMAAGNQQQPSVFSSGTGITVAKIDRTKHVDTPSMKGMPGTPLPSVVQVANEGQSVKDLGKKSSIFDLPPNDRGSHGVAIHADDHVSNTSAEAKDCDHDVAADERPPPLINEVRHNIHNFGMSASFLFISALPLQSQTSLGISIFTVKILYMVIYTIIIKRKDLFVCNK